MADNHKENVRWKKQYYTIAAGQAVSIIGSSAVQFSLIWWLASETASPLVMALAGLCAYLPQMVLGPFAGVWVDRWKRKTIVICADLFQGALAAVLALVFVLGNPPPWSVCVVLFVRSVGGVFHTPAIQAIVPMLVPQQHLVKANGVSQFLQGGAFLLGPVLGAALYAVFPMPVLLLTDLLGALVASATVAAVVIPEVDHRQGEKPHILREMKEGAAAFRDDRHLGIVTLAVAVCMIFFMPLSSMYPLMISDYFGASAWHASAVQTTYAVGMMAGAAVVGTRIIKNKLSCAMLGVAILGVTAFLCGILPANTFGLWAFAAICMVMGGSMNIYNVPYMAYLQERIPREKQGRVLSLVGSLMSFAMPVGLLVAGPVAEYFGLLSWFLTAGIALIVIMGFTALYLRSRATKLLP